MSRVERGATAAGGAESGAKQLTLVEARAGLHGVAERPLTVFTHIPKCAGTAFENILDAVAKSRGRTVRRIRGSIYGQFLGPGKFQNCERVLEPGAMPEIPEEVAFLTGHVPFGVHRQIARDCLYVTLLREPEARCRSHFRHGVERGGWPADTPLADLFASGALIDNPQVRQLAGLADPAAPCGAREVKAALRNLEEVYGLVGTQERFDDFLTAMIALYDWPAVCYGVDRGPEVEEPEGETPAWRQALRDRHACDRELYAEVARRQPLWRRDLESGTAPGGEREVLITAPFLRFPAAEDARSRTYCVSSRAGFRDAIEPLLADGRMQLVEAGQ